MFAEFYSKNLRIAEEKGVPVAPLRAVLGMLRAQQVAMPARKHDNLPL